jgi:hypothetical protein
LSSGRTALIQLDNPEISERFSKVAEDVRDGKLPIALAAQEFGVSVKTIRRTIATLKKRDTAAKTYAPVTEWNQLPKIHQFAAWAISRANTPKSKKNEEARVEGCKRIWSDCLNKKNLALLTEEDMITFVNWKNNLSAKQGTKLWYIGCMRLLIRYGFGDPSWLERFLGTKGQKGEPRMPPELKNAETFVTVMPRLYHALDKLRNDGTINEYEYDAQHLTEHAKSTLQVRTGDHNEQREWWGTVINNPNAAGSSLLVHWNFGDTRVLHWTVKCKGRETWEVPREAFEACPGLVEEFETFIAKYQLKTGDYLIDQQRLNIDRSLDILKFQSKIAELSNYILHDFRKVSATSLALADVRVEDAINFGVGWLDPATYIKHYLAIKRPNMARAYAQVRAFYEGRSN